MATRSSIDRTSENRSWALCSAVLDGWTATMKCMARTAHAASKVVGSGIKGSLSRDHVDAMIEKWASDCIRHTQANIHVKGRENIQTGQPYVVLSNHQSSFDIMAMFHAFPHSLRMAAKAELFRVPIFGRAMNLAEFIRVDRANQSQAREAITTARERINSGISVWMAPEGTRSHDGKLLPFKKGGAVLAIQTQTPILPATISGTRDILHPSSLRASNGQHATVTFHPPIAMTGRTMDDRNDVLALTRAAIESAL